MFPPAVSIAQSIHYIQYFQILLYAAIFSWALLIYCLNITQDHRKRQRMWLACADKDAKTLRAEFHKSMFILALFVQQKKRSAVPSCLAENALVLATVLRERIHLAANTAAPASYLHSRRALLREAAQMPLS